VSELHLHVEETTLDDAVFKAAFEAARQAMPEAPLRKSTEIAMLAATGLMATIRTFHVEQEAPAAATTTTITAARPPKKRIRRTKAQIAAAKAAAPSVPSNGPSVVATDGALQPPPQPQQAVAVPPPPGSVRIPAFGAA